MPSETVHLDGHIIDALIFSKVLDIILHEGGEYRIVRFDVGQTKTDQSHAEIVITAPDSHALDHILHVVQQHGAGRTTGEVTLVAAPSDGVFPEGFYSTTNLATDVLFDGRWVPMSAGEMDCGIVVADGAALCTPLHRVRVGDPVVVGDRGVRVTPLERRDPTDAFGFMSSEVSTERPKGLVISAVVQAMSEARASGRKVLFVGGPAILHTNAGRHLEAMIRAGWVHALFAGNALATHDIERALFGTSLGVELTTGLAMVHGHEHHLRAINRIRGLGGIRQAIDAGVLRSGIMHALVTTSTPFVLAGSIRDDGPLPEVITDVVVAQDAMRALIPGVGVALMVATTLHSVATGNMLPASVRTVCVDADADTVIKLNDRGTHQALGLVTDCEFFLKELASQLPGVVEVQ